MTSYKTVYIGGTGEIIEKKSRFIANVTSIETEEEALAHIAALKKQYWDARHNCYAFVAGPHHELQRCSDDGEPAGTAGRPMLDVLLKEDIHNTLIVVTRYFGGTLLGTGGLVRAYQKAAQEGLAASVIIEKRPGIPLTVDTDYNSVGKIQYILSKEQIPTMDSIYTDMVSLKLMVPEERLTTLLAQLTEATSGQAEFMQEDTVLYAEIDGAVEIF